MKFDENDNPHAWIKRVRSNLLLAEKGGTLKDILLLEDLCFNAQQATEKALKAVCVAKKIDFPKTHSLVRLFDVLEENGIEISEKVKDGDMLTQYAVQTRYQGWAEEITRDEYVEVLELAARIVFWADTFIE